MPDTKKIKTLSPLVQSVVGLDSYFSELLRLGVRIEDLNVNTDSDYEMLQKLLNHFAESGQGLENEVANLSKHLNDMRTQADEVAKSVGEKVKKWQERKAEVQKKMDEFRLLNEKVRELALSLNNVKPTSENVTEEERTRITNFLGEFEIKLHPLIEEAKTLKNIAHESKMKVLEQSADSLGQSLLAMSKRINTAREVRP